MWYERYEVVTLSGRLRCALLGVNGEMNGFLPAPLYSAGQLTDSFQGSSVLISLLVALPVALAWIYGVFGAWGWSWGPPCRSGILLEMTSPPILPGLKLKTAFHFYLVQSRVSTAAGISLRKSFTVKQASCWLPNTYCYSIIEPIHR